MGWTELAHILVSAFFAISRFLMENHTLFEKSLRKGQSKAQLKDHKVVLFATTIKVKLSYL